MKGRTIGGRRRMQMLQKMFMWHRSKMLKIDGDGDIERHVKNLLFSGILEEKKETCQKQDYMKNILI